MICDRSFDHHNQLTDPFTNRRPPADGILAETILVNGAYMPHHRVGACRYRLRLLNVSAFRSYNLQLSNGAPMIQIATESGLMPKPIRRREILLGPAERVEVIVDFAGRRGESVELRSSKRHAGRNPDGAHTYGGALMQFRVGGERVPTAPACRATCGRYPPGPARPSRKPDKRWDDHDRRLLQDQVARSTAGPSTRPTRRHFPKLNTTETWEIDNKTNVAHVMHLHHSDWFLLERNGRRPPPWENCLKETFFVYPNEKILLAGHFADYTGKFVDPLPHAGPRGSRPDEPIPGGSDRTD